MSVGPTQSRRSGGGIGILGVDFILCPFRRLVRDRVAGQLQAATAVPVPTVNAVQADAR